MGFVAAARFAAGTPGEWRKMDKVPERRNGVQQSTKAGFVPSILMAVALNPLNSATISVGLAVVLQALHAGSAGITWIVSGYYLGSAVAQPVMGTLGDRLGYRRFVYLGFLLILITAVMAPFSHNLWVFVGWRVIQAIGTSMVFPNAIGLVRRWEADRVPTVLGWIGMSAGIALAVGPALGGLLIAHFGWQSIFWLNIPIALAAGLLLQFSVPDDRPSQSGAPGVFDWTGSALFTLTMVLLLVYSTNSSSRWLLLVLGAASLFALLQWERRRTSPIIPVAWFSDITFSLVAMVTVITNLVMYVALYGIPVLLETRRHLSVSASGLMLLVFAGVLALASPLGGWLARGPARRIPYMMSAFTLLAGTILLWLSQTSHLVLVAGALGLLGLSFAVSNVLLQQMVLEARPPAESGRASGLFSLMRYVGTMASSVVVTLSFSGLRGAGLMYRVLAAAAMVNLVAAFALPKFRRVFQSSAGD